MKQPNRIARLTLVIFAIFQIPNVIVGDELEQQLNDVENFVASHCLECHSTDEPKGKFDLESFDFSAKQFSARDFDTANWEKMLRRIDSRQMPPPNTARPNETEYLQIVNTLSATLAKHAERFPRPGRVGFVRRLTRAEYQNSIRDLVAIDIDAAEYLPKDESSHGFDNITVEELSPTLMNRYVSAAQKISRAALGGMGNGPIGVTVRLPADRSQEKHVEGLPFGTRGGTLFKQNFSQTGEYEFELKLTRDRDEKVEGLNREHHIDILVDKKRMHQFKLTPPKGSGNWNNRDFTHSDSHLKTRIRIEAGPHDVGITFPKTFSSLVETKRQPFDANFNRHRHPRKTPAIYQVSIVGPFSPEGVGDTPSRRLILGDNYSKTEIEQSSEAEQKDIAKNIVSKFLKRAYRRPIKPEDLSTPLEFFEAGFDEAGFEAGIESAITAVLVNPNFLFKIEEDRPEIQSGQAFPISDLELASRLAFFLWSSGPDEELLKLAENHELQNDDVLEKQVERMLADEKAHSLTSNFAAQWLYLRNLESITPDLRQFPDFDDNLRQAFRGETEHLFNEVRKNDGSVLGLIKSDHTFLNERLATHYGIPKVSGSHFRQVDLEPDSLAGKQRGGILRHGSILMATSYATRTSPTIRGNWVLENIIGTPAPPPPANVTNLKENTTLDVSSVRERLALHRANPACASCHDLIDPVGFSLENYDAVGRWRDFEETLDVDSKGVMPDGTEIGSVAELELGILKRPEVFVQTMTEKLLTFATGRAVEPFDGPAVRNIVSQAAQEDFRFSSIVKGIVLSQPFRMRSKE